MQLSGTFAIRREDFEQHLAKMSIKGLLCIQLIISGLTGPPIPPCDITANPKKKSRPLLHPRASP